jgi:enoyl-CoA hydratase
MAYEFVQVECAEGVGTITLNRPKANALNKELVTEIGQAVEALSRDASIGAIVITGGESKFFSGGADIPSLVESFGDPLADGAPLPAGLKTMDIIENCPKPVIAAVNGIAVGGGCELTLACHMRIAADTARFGQPEINLGIVPGWGGCHRLPRIIGHGRALDWLTTGRMVGADEALAAGLVSRVVPAEELAAEAAKLAQELAGKAPIALAGILRAAQETSLHPEKGKTLEAEVFCEAAASEDAQEGVAAFLEKRAPKFCGK